jgi:Flagellar biosynthesis protein, FliO
MTMPKMNAASFPAVMPVAMEGESLKNFETSTGLLSRLWRWLRSFQISGASERRLKVADTVSLGDKRFVAVVQVDGKNFLLAGGPANIALLAQLNEKDDFGAVLQQTMVAPPEAPAPAPAVVLQSVEKPARRRIKRRKPAVAKVPAPAPVPVAAKPVKRASPAPPAKKAASAAMKKQPALAAKRSSHAAAPAPRFGGIPPAGDGSRAFERWLGRTVATPHAQPVPAKNESSRKSAPASAPAPAPAPAAAPAVPVAVGPSPVPARPAMSEPLTEVRPSEKPVVTTVPEPVPHTKIEEYA